MELQGLFGKQDSAKALVFTILTKEYPLKLIELHNIIKRRYGKSVTYQAVRKAVHELLEDNVLTSKGIVYELNKNWIEQIKSTFDDIANDLNRGPRKARDHSTEDITVYEFPNLAALMHFWQEQIFAWAKKLDSKKKSTNYYQTAHAWEGLFSMERERELMESVIKRKVESVTVITGSSALDTVITRFYKNIGVQAVQRPASNSFDRGYHVGTYDDLVIHTTIPPKLVEAIDKYFHKHKALEDLDLKALSTIINQKLPVKLTIIRDAQTAMHINNSIRSLVEN